MCAPDFAAPPPEHTADAGYDIHEDAALIAQSIAKQYGVLPSAQEDLSWADWSQLVAGLMEDTPLGRIVAIRLEDDPEVLQRYTPEQRRIRNAWRQRQAKQRRPADEKAIKAQMAQLQQALRAAFSK